MQGVRTVILPRTANSTSRRYRIPCCQHQKTTKIVVETARCANRCPHLIFGRAGHHAKRLRPTPGLDFGSSLWPGMWSVISLTGCGAPFAIVTPASEPGGRRAPLDSARHPWVLRRALARPGPPAPPRAVFVLCCRLPRWYPSCCTAESRVLSLSNDHCDLPCSGHLPAS